MESRVWHTTNHFSANRDLGSNSTGNTSMYFLRLSFLSRPCNNSAAPGSFPMRENWKDTAVNPL